MNAAPVATPHPYAEHLRTRWLARNTLMCVQGFVISFLWVLLEWLTALDTGAPYGWAQLLPRALPAVAAPSGILGSVFLHRRPHRRAGAPNWAHWCAGTRPRSPPTGPSSPS